MAENNLGLPKKKLKNGTILVFLDESGYSLIPFVHRTWALKGMKATLVHSWRRRGKLSVISGIAVWYKDKELHTKMSFRIHQGKAISGKEVGEFLHQIKAQLNGEIIFVWDNLSIHKSKPVKRFLANNSRFKSRHLPPYCPELNPDENVWNWTKTSDLAGVCPENSSELLQKVRRSLRKFQRKKSLHLASLKQSELTWSLLLD